jgi:hypothetical protein
VFYQVNTPERWQEGWFAVHEDSHLHVTFKMDKPGWLNFFIACRRLEGGGPSSINYLFDGLRFWERRAGRWYTVSIPLSKFKRLANVPEKPFENQLPYMLMFSALEPDRGLVIDRIWVTRGGSGEVEYSEVE